MDMGQDRQMQMVGGHVVGDQNRYNAMQNAGNQVGQNAVQNVSIQNVGNHNGLIVVLGITNPSGNGNVVAARAEGNGNQIRCYKCKGLGHYAMNCTEEAGIQLQAENFDLMAATGDIDEIEEVNANCILMANLQQASTSSTQTDKPPIYDSDGSAKVHHYENYYDNDIFNMFTQEEQYTELLEPITEPHTVQQNNSNVISVESSVEHSGGTVEQHPTTVEETRAYSEPLYNNLVTEVKKVNMAKFDELKTGYRKSVYQEQYLAKKINSLYLSSAKQITTLNEKITNLNNQLSKEKSIVSSLKQEKEKLKDDFKTCENELLDKLIQYKKKIKELDNILVKTGKSIQTMHMLSPKPDSFYHTEQKMALEKHDPPAVYGLEETLQLAQESRLKMKQLNKEIKPTNYAKINKLSEVFVSQKAKLREEADESLDTITNLEKENKRLMRAVFSQDTMSIMQSPPVVETSNLQNELERMKERFKNCIVKKENKYAKLWNDWYKKCEECKYDKILYDKAYNNKQHQIERLKAQLGDLKGKSIDTQCASATLDPLYQKLDDENMSLELQVVEEHDLTKPVTSHSVPKSQESKVVKNDKVIAPRMFSINPSKTYREEKFVPINQVRTKLITVSQPHVITKQDVNPNSNGLSSTGVDNTAKTRRPQPKSIQRMIGSPLRLRVVASRIMK
ncbi:retrovirus-related pol polyprotein from transposon TNT 1-94 [Tanacetum coccineum]|uniref:Retrovirus-related pol polyprotein from transposon TNT 1-94 n=1 Tax=Tanacetum coccineum TaxID=301880 RepID=A0ABQ4Z143_9ASTR